jgi:hypothetical protein
VTLLEVGELALQALQALEAVLEKVEELHEVSLRPIASSELCRRDEPGDALFLAQEDSPQIVDRDGLTGRGGRG